MRLGSFFFGFFSLVFKLGVVTMVVAIELKWKVLYILKIQLVQSFRWVKNRMINFKAYTPIKKKNPLESLTFYFELLIIENK